MTTTSSYLKYLPPVLWSPQPPGNAFSLGAMLCVFEKILTGIDDGIVITHGNQSVMTTVTQAVSASPIPQTIHVTPGTGLRFRIGSSYTYNGAPPEVVTITAVTTNTITAVFRHNHPAYQTIIDSSGAHRDIQTIIAGLVNLYGAWTTPSAYLDWLGQWVALQMNPAWDEYQRRAALARIVGIYAQRGTKPGIDTYFDLYAIAKQRPRVVVDNDSKILFCAPQAGMIVPISTLVSQRPLIAPQCIAFDASGYLLVGDLGSSDSTIKPALWRISRGGAYDYSAGGAGLSPAPQPFQPAGLNLQAPIAIAVDGKFGGAYLIDQLGIANYWLYRLTSPQNGSVTLSGTSTVGETVSITLDGIVYSFSETGAAPLALQAAAIQAALSGTASFAAKYAAQSAGATITISPLSGVPANALTLVTGSANLALTATGPGFATSAVFANNASAPPLGLKFPKAMTVNGAGHPLILDRGAPPGTPSATQVVDVQIAGAPPTYSGAPLRHNFPMIREPLSMLLRADGSLLVGDASHQTSAAPADIYAIDTTTWTAISLLGALPPDSNPLVAPTGIVEVDAKHLLVLDAGLRPFVPDAGAPFNSIIARQATVYAIDLSVATPTVTCISQLKSLVYPRGMVADGAGTLYICDSGLPDLSGYRSREWRSGAQQLSAAVQFQGNPAGAVFCVVLSGAPTSGEQCSFTAGGIVFPLSEAPVMVAQQAGIWADILNGTPAFSALYTALAVGNSICIYAVAGTNATGVAFATASSPNLTITGGLLAIAVTLAGTPTTGESGIVNIGGASYTLPETTGNTLAAQATAWSATLNAATPFNQDYNAVAVANTILIFYNSDYLRSNLPMFVTGSIHLTVTAVAQPQTIGTVTLSGTPTSGETCTLALAIGLLPPRTFALTASTGNTLAQQAAAWCVLLNGTPNFQSAFIANSAGAVINLFALPTIGSSISLTVTSSAHLALAAYSELQNRKRFLQSISDVLSDEIPAHARWALQSE